MVSALVAPATEARIKLESRYDNKPGDSLTKITLGAGDKTKTYRGTGHVWVWYRRGGVGPHSAISALLALRKWAVQEAQNRPVAEVADQILGMGDSLAYVAVALSLFIAHFGNLTDELDPYLEQPAVWHLESSRYQNEHGGLVHQLKENDPLRAQLDRIVMRYLLGNKERRTELKAVGERLIANTRAELTTMLGKQPEDDQREMLIARKWAGLLDYDLYKLSDSDEPGYSLLEIQYPQDLVEALGKDAATPELNIRASNLLFAAQGIRDGEKTGNAVELWQETTKTLKEFERLGVKQIIHAPAEVIACVAASVVVTTAKGQDCPDGTLQEAVAALIEVAMATPSVTDMEDAHRQRGMLWPQGADRSTATALPLLLLTPDLLERSSVHVKTVKSALLELAQGVTTESRQRLVHGLGPALNIACTAKDHTLHDIAFEVLDKLIRSGGVNEKRVDYRIQPTYLKESLNKQLATDKYVLHLGMAADALPWLIRASHLECRHAKEAKTTLDALIGHDLLAWPAHYAGQHYVDTQDWRSCIDTYVAERVLNGDTALLTRYLDAFAPAPEDLNGILYRLAEQAKSKEQGQRLFEVWPILLDRLLPVNRASSADSKRRTFSRDTDELDKSLLPTPSKGAVWPPELMISVLGRWGQTFTSRPDYLERLLGVMAAYGLALYPVIIPFVLNVAGSDYERIARSSSTLMVMWVKLLLEKSNLTDVDRTKLVSFIDNLARLGDADALELQRNLES